MSLGPKSLDMVERGACGSCEHQDTQDWPVQNSDAELTVTTVHVEQEASTNDDASDAEKKSQIVSFLSPCIGAGGKRPPRVSLYEVFASGVLSFLGIGALALLYFIVSKTCTECTEVDVVQLVGSFGASAVLVFAAPKVPLAQPRNLIGGHLISAVVGVSAYECVAKPMNNVALATPLAVSVSIMLMHLTSTLHPPAGGTTMIAVLGSSRVHDMGLLWVLSPVMTSAVTLLIIAIIGNALFGRPYPQYWVGGSAKEWWF